MFTHETVQNAFGSRIERAKLSLVFQEIQDQVEALGPGLSESQAQGVDVLAPGKGYYLSFEIQRKGLGSQIKVEQILDIFKTDADLIKGRKSHVTSQASLLGVSKFQLMHYLRIRDLKKLTAAEYDKFRDLLDRAAHPNTYKMFLKFEEDDRRRAFIRKCRGISIQPQLETLNAEGEAVKVELTGFEKALKAIDELRERERQIFILKAQKVQNIGEIFNVTNGTVRQIYQKARRKLKHRIDQNIFTNSDLEAAIDLRKNAVNSFVEEVLEEQKRLSERREQEFKKRQEENTAALQNMVAKYDEFLDYVSNQGQRCLDAQIFLSATAASAEPVNSEVWATIDKVFKLGYLTFEERRNSTNAEFKLAISRLQHSLLPQRI